MQREGIEVRVAVHVGTSLAHHSSENSHMRLIVRVSAAAGSKVGSEDAATLAAEALQNRLTSRAARAGAEPCGRTRSDEDAKRGSSAWLAKHALTRLHKSQGG